MNRQRAIVLLLQLILCVQAGFVAAVVPPAATPTLAAGSDCQLSTSTGGGTLSACPGADTYADYTTDFSVGLESLRSQRATSSLQVTSSPDGATVFLNGLEAGMTPVDTKVAAGSYLVRVEKAGFAPFSKTVSVAADRPASVSATLAPTATALGSFNWLRAGTLIGQSGGYSDGQLSVTSFVRDRDGAYWVAFVNYADREFILDEPINGPGFLPFITKPRVQLKVSGVAKSTDDGQSWTVVRSWSDTFSARAWTSDEFIDSQWDPVANGFPASFKKHTMHAYYHERTVEQYWVEDLIPREGGGVSIVLYTYKAHLPQELQYAWDNIANPNFPGEFMGDTVERLNDDPVFEEVSSEEAQSRWGVSREDLATYWWQASADGRSLVASDGGESPMTVSGVNDYTVPKYQGSHEGVDYFLAYQPDGSDVGGVGYILASRDGGRTLTLDTTYPLGERAGRRQPVEDLRIGPDGTKYLIVHYQFVGDVIESLIYEVESGGRLRELGKTPPNVTVGVAGGNNLPFLSADFDSSGGMHAAFRGSITPDDNSTINVYYQYFPRSPVDYDSVALLTQPNCAGCQAAADFLRDAGVVFSENPSSLPADVAATVATEASSAGYPVLVRLGDEPVVAGGANVASISRLLGVSHPVLIESHAPRRVQGSPYAALQPQWLLMVVEDDQPKVVIDRADGVVALSLDEGVWTSSPLLGTPDSVSDAPGIGFAKHYPAFPGGTGANFYSVQYDKPYNHIDRLSDFVYLYHSASTAVQDQFGETNTQFDYTLWTTDAPAESSAYRAMTTVSQLIPSGVFYVALGDTGDPGTISGELAQYVTDQGVVTQDGQRFYRVVADLRAQDETATDGNIVARTIAGSLSVDSQTEDGAPETRDVSLILLVQNTRLRAFDPDTPNAARDISNEAVHFAGTDENWVVINNIALPNSVPCGPDQAIVLDPNSYVTFNAATVADFELDPCLDALEVQPTVISDCTSWDDAKLVLAADTIDSLSQSLPLLRSAGETNYDAAFGGRDATVYRVVSLDDAPAGGPLCPSEVTGMTGAVVRIQGRILGGTETFTPTVSIVAHGAVQVRTASTALPKTIAWQREWLELESAFLEASLSVSMDEEALWDYISFSASDRRDQYMTELLATRALLHCNYEGRDIAAVRDLISRTDVGSDALFGVAHCLADFVIEPYKHWSHANTPAWPARTVSFIGSVVNQSLSSNPTLSFLVSDAAADPALYGRLLIARARDLETKASSSIRGLAMDYALDHYARLLTASSAGMGGGARAGVTRAVLMASPLERQTVRDVIACARSFGSANPFGQMFELTQARSYTAGIPCVDSQSSSQAKVDTYRRLAIGLRGGLFAAIFQSAGTDLDLLYNLSDMVNSVMDEVDRVEGQYGPGTKIDAWQPDQPPLVRFTIVRRHIESLVEARGKHVTVGEAKAVLKGAAECGVGFVKALLSREGLALIGLGVAAFFAGPFALAAGGVLFVGSGVAFTGLMVYNLQQAWEGLDLAGRVAGICGAALSAVMTIAPVKGLVKFARRTPVQLRAAPPKVIDEATLPNSGRANGVPQVEQAADLSGQGGSVKGLVQAEPLRSATVEALIDAMPEAKGPTVGAIADLMSYDSMDAVQKSIFDQMAEAYGKSLDDAFAKRLELINEADTDAAVQAAVDTGAAFLIEVSPLPKSIRVKGGPGGLLGSDAELVRATAGNLDGIGEITDVANSRGGDAALRASTSMMEAVLRSTRLRELLEFGSAGERILSASERFCLQRLRRNAGSAVTDELIAELAQARFPDALRQALTDAGVTPGSVVSVNADLLAIASYKTVFRFTVERAGQPEPTGLVVKLGVIDAAEGELLSQLAADDLGARHFALLERANGGEAISIDELVVGDDGYNVWLQSLLQGAPDASVPRAMGAWDALAYVRTSNGSGSGYFNIDFHLANYIREASGALKVVDADARMGSTIPERLYFSASLLRRNAHPDSRFGFGASGFDAYVSGLADTLTAEYGPARMRQILEAARDDLRDPGVQADILELQDRSKVTGIADLDFKASEVPADAARTVTAIEAYLSSH